MRTTLLVGAAVSAVILAGCSDDGPERVDGRAAPVGSLSASATPTAIETAAPEPRASGATPSRKPGAAPARCPVQMPTSYTRFVYQVGGAGADSPALNMSIPVPAGWTKEVDGTRVAFRQPNGPGGLFVERSEMEGSSTVEALRRWSEQRRASYADYRVTTAPRTVRLNSRSTPSGGNDQAELGFTFGSEAGPSRSLVYGVSFPDRGATLVSIQFVAASCSFEPMSVVYRRAVTYTFSS